MPTNTAASGAAALAAAIAAQKSKVEYETSLLKSQQEMLLEWMQVNDLIKVEGETEDGQVYAITVCNGKRTVSVTDPALKAEIKLLQERGVRTGRCEERVGQKYCLTRKIA